MVLRILSTNCMGTLLDKCIFLKNVPLSQKRHMQPRLRVLHPCARLYVRNLKPKQTSVYQVIVDDDHPVRKDVLRSRRPVLHRQRFPLLTILGPFSRLFAHNAIIFILSGRKCVFLGAHTEYRYLHIYILDCISRVEDLTRGWMGWRQKLGLRIILYW